MKTKMVLISIFSLSLSHCSSKRPVILMKTTAGEITFRLDAKHAPVSTQNFLRYVEEGRYQGASFYRTVTASNQPNNNIKIAVIQGGLGNGDEPQPQRLPEIAHETTKQTGLLHRDGTLSMARAAPGTASSEIFICIGDQPELDFGGKRNPDGQGFAAFGQVIRGMDVVRKIHEQPEKDQMLLKPVAIQSVELK